MFGYCEMYRARDFSEDVKKEIEQKKEEFKNIIEQAQTATIIDFVTRMPK